MRTTWECGLVYHLKTCAELPKQLKMNFSELEYPYQSASKTYFTCDEIAALEQQQLKECFLHLGMQEKAESLREMSGTPLLCVKSPSQ
jgi:hypothetical protein